MTKSRSLSVQGTPVSFITRHEQDYISLTDMVKRFGDESVLYGWLRNRNTVEFLGVWELINNPAFKPLEFERFKSQAGLNSFSLSPSKWVEATGAIGLFAKAGRGGGTYAHRDIAFEFGSWLSPEFKLYLITEFQRLKDEEARTSSLEWNFQRTLAKVNYRIHTERSRLIRAWSGFFSGYPVVIGPNWAVPVWPVDADLGDAGAERRRDRHAIGAFDRLIAEALEHLAERLGNGFVFEVEEAHESLEHRGIRCGGNRAPCLGNLAR